MNPLLLSLFGAVVAVYAGLVFFAWRTARQVERLVPPIGQFIDVNGARVHYVDRGSGPVTVVLLHGLGGTLRHFTARLVELLARDYRVVAFDRPGSGYSRRAPGGAAGPRAQAELVAAFIRALDLDRPVLLGHSLGGAIALATALAHPTLVRGVALVAPLTRPMLAVPEVFAGLVIPSVLMRRMIGWTLAVPLSIVRRDVVLAAVFGPEPVPADFGITGGALLGLRPSAFIATSTDLMAVPGDLAAMDAAYARLSVPVSMLYGTADRILSPAHHATGFAALVPHTDLEWVEGAGHMLPLTVPERVAALVRRVASRAHADASDCPAGA